MDFDIYKICERLTPQEETLGVKRVSPVWGAHMSAQEYFEHMLKRVEAAQRLLLPGELSCTLAHLDVYKRISKLQRPALILEDDISLTHETLARVQNTVRAIDNPDFVSFAEYRHSFQKTEILPNIYVPDTSNGFWGTACYYISLRMAEALRDWHTPVIDKADNWQSIFTHCPFTPYYAPVFTHDGAASNIFKPGADRSKLSQNPSFYSALRLRFSLLRMVFLSRKRHQKHLKSDQKRRVGPARKETT